MSQTSYSLSHVPGYEGSRGDSRPAMIISAKNSSVAEIPFGRFVAKDMSGGEQGAKILDSGSNVILGVALLDMARNQRGGNWVSGSPVTAADNGIQIGDLFSVISRGAVWMIAEEALAVGDPVFARFDATGATGSQALGRVRNDADTGKAVAITNARLLTAAAAAGDAVLVDLNLP